ncbi:DUF1697 domain-containing protein [Cellulosimicrobium marinum]|uniref:DUF1697 domain-containing protein n=1 Tax=Cellulosimicrobium marinum TaxID=1638992 RepID=UPI001E42CCE4|nr:DUF1697 domain-containing protein [Cellulosimicrobium marinum]MCB7136556.1 DUF1697 domain-containing protein [Cellulosimicrobium marinum]
MGRPPPGADTVTVYVALLFAVNVGGRKVPSTRLRELAGDLGLGDARTVVNSGNLVVTPGTSGVTGPDDVARLVRGGVADRFGVDAAVAVLTAERLRKVVLGNPLPDDARDRPAALLVHVGEFPVDPDAAAAIDARPGKERAAVANGVLYVAYPDGVGRSTLTTATLTRAAGTPVTGRNWNTTTRLLALADELADT